MGDAVLTVADVAEYLQLSEKTVLKMVREGEIPCAKVGNQWRFIGRMLEDWLISRMNVVPRNDLSRLITKNFDLVPLSRLTDPEWIRTDLTDGGKEQVLRDLMEPALRNGLINDGELFLKGLLERENMVSTALGAGVAVPHLRKPDASLQKGPRLSIGYAPQGVHFGSPDGELTYLFFLILSDSEVVHLRILSRIGALVKDNSLAQELRGMDSQGIFRYLIERENVLLQSGLDSGVNK